MKNLHVEKSIIIQASKEEVWDALINPEKIKVYLFGTSTKTDWIPGSSISFRGEYQGTVYNDKGKVLENNEFQLLKYNYWSAMSGLEDNPNNYSIVCYTLKEQDPNNVLFTWRQEGFSSEKGHAHTEKFLPEMLEVIKKLVEKN